MQEWFTTSEVVSAIAYWRTHEQSEPNVLGCNTSILADVFGYMIYHKLDSFPAKQLTAAQTEALAKALLQIPLF